MLRYARRGDQQLISDLNKRNIDELLVGVGRRWLRCRRCQRNMLGEKNGVGF